MSAVTLAVFNPHRRPGQLWPRSWGPCRLDGLSKTYAKLGHYVVVLVRQVVAVNLVDALAGGESHPGLDCLVFTDVDYFIRSAFAGERRLSVAADDLEIHQVDVKRVEPAACFVLGFPDLHRDKAWQIT